MAGYREERWNVGDSGKTGAVGIAWYDGRGAQSLAGADTLAGAKEAAGAFFTRTVDGATVVAEEVRDYVLANSQFRNTTDARIEGVARGNTQGFTVASGGTSSDINRGATKFFQPGETGIITASATFGGYVPIGLLMRDGFEIVGFYVDIDADSPNDDRVRPAPAAYILT